MRFVRWFSDVGLPDVGLVGGKNASLGERHRRRNAGRRRRRRGRRALGVSSEAHSPITLMSTRFSRRPSNSP